MRLMTLTSASPWPIWGKDSRNYSERSGINNCYDVSTSRRNRASSVSVSVRMRVSNAFSYSRLTILSRRLSLRRPEKSQIVPLFGFGATSRSAVKAYLLERRVLRCIANRPAFTGTQRNSLRPRVPKHFLIPAS